MINTIIINYCVNVKNTSNDYLKTGGCICVKIYDYKGRKNICGNRVYEARAKKRLTQSELSAQLHVRGVMLERDSISRIEIGTRFVADYEVVEIAKVLDVSPMWLLGLE